MNISHYIVQYIIEMLSDLDIVCIIGFLIIYVGMLFIIRFDPTKTQQIEIILTFGFYSFLLFVVYMVSTNDPIDVIRFFELYMLGLLCRFIYIASIICFKKSEFNAA